MKVLRLFVALFLTAAIFIALNYRYETIPPLGKFLNPFAGFWVHSSSLDEPPEQLDLPGLIDSVTIIWDSRMVPHIYAQNNHDLYFAQGYITARDRLWQMDFKIRAAEGRLSEIVGEATLNYDWYHRRVGIDVAAQTTYQKMMQDPETQEILIAYTSGVDAYIDNLSYKTLPLEYKILNYEPESWHEINAALILKQMAWSLTAYNIRDFNMTRFRAAFGDSLAELMFPQRPPYTTPIISPENDWNFDVDLPEPPDNYYLPDYPGLRSFRQTTRPTSEGSNNWVVAADKTASGNPILCNDPHLGLNLPNIWYEVHLNSPSQNVYGVSLPGAPGVIIGFNDDIAWGVTNGETDVVDFYSLKFKDSTLREYEYDGEWYKTRLEIDTIKVRGGTDKIDTTLITRHGRVIVKPKKDNSNPFDASFVTAMKWTGYEPTNDMKTFVLLNRARNYDDYMGALTHFNCPSQNFIFASKDNDIAITHCGLFPIRWHGQGRYINDGTDPKYDWGDYIPFDHLPHIKNPDQNYITSANQYPVNEAYPYYIDGNHAAHCRSTRLNERLGEMENISTDSMISLQLDIENIHAKQLLPLFLKNLRIDSLNELETKCYNELSSWDCKQDAEMIAPTIFEEWWRHFRRAMLNDEFGDQLSYPRFDAIINLILNYPQSEFYDNTNTAQEETLADLIRISFSTAVGYLADEFRDFGSNWRWGKTRQTHIIHLGQIPGMGITNLQTDGRYEIVNATDKKVGPSWRMTVELGDTVKAWGIYPGGQSGNPGSDYYDNMIDDWVNGRVFELIFERRPEDLISHPDYKYRSLMRSGE